MRILRVVSAFAFTAVLVGLGVLPAQAGEECAVAVVCPPPTVPPTPSPTPTPTPTPDPAPAPAPQPEPAPAPQPQPAPVMRDEPGSAARLLELVNHTRVEHGLVPLSAHEGAAAIAVEHSREMADGHDIWHNDALFTKATRDRLGAHAVAENVAMNSSADGAHERLMASDGHRANILTATFTAGAVRAVRGDDGRLYVTEVFIEPMAPARPATATTTRPAPSAVGAAKAQKPSAPPADPTPAATTSPVDPDPDRSSQPAPEDVELAAGVAFSGPLPRSAGNDGLGPMAMLAALALAGVVAALVIGIFGRAAMTA